MAKTRNINGIVDWFCDEDRDNWITEADRKHAFSYNETILENDCKAMGKTFVPGYRKEDGTYVHGYCREMTEKEKSDKMQNYKELSKMMSKYPKKKTLKKSYAMGGDDYIDVYQPMNPIEDIIGGEVKFRSKKRKNRRKK